MENHLNKVADAILRYLDANQFETFTDRKRVYEAVFHPKPTIDTAVLHLKREGMRGYIETLEQSTKDDVGGYAIKITPEGSEFINRTSFVKEVKEAEKETNYQSQTIIATEGSTVIADQSSNKTEATKAPTTTIKKIIIGVIVVVIGWFLVQFVLMPMIS